MVTVAAAFSVVVLASGGWCSSRETPNASRKHYCRAERNARSRLQSVVHSREFYCARARPGRRNAVGKGVVGSRKHFVSERAAAVVAERSWNRNHAGSGTASVARFNGVAIEEGSTGA